MSEKAQALVEEIKKDAEVILKKHVKAALAEINEVIVPKSIDLAAEAIPGPVDNVIAEYAKKPVVDALAAAIEAI